MRTDKLTEGIAKPTRSDADDGRRWPEPGTDSLPAAYSVFRVARRDVQAVPLMRIR